MTIARWLLLAFILAGNFVSTSALAQSVPGVPFGRSCPERFPADGNLGAAFFDAGWQSCWSCPVGYNRSAAPVTAVNGCSKAITAQHSKATRTGTFTCAGKYGEGAFEDSYDDGSCWKCPPDAPTRTWDPVYSATACQQASFTNRKPAIRVGKPTCESGFKDSFEGGTCWTCPPGYNRTALHVSWSGDQACEKTEEIAPGVQRGRQDDPPVSDCPAAPAVPNPSDMTLFVATDLHFGKEDAGGIVTSQSLLRHVAEMNALPSRNVKWPNPGFASDVIGEPVAIVTTGDNTHYGQSWQFEFFRWLYEPEQRTLKNYPDAIKWPVFVGNGNHDIAGDCYMNNCALRSYNYITTRHRAGCMGVTNFHDGSHNYSWDMNGIHFVQLHTWAGDTRLGANGTHEPGLDWLKADLAKIGPGRPVVLFQHYPLKNEYWSVDEQQAFWGVIENYNVIAMFAGHTHSPSFYTFEAKDLNIKNPKNPNFKLPQFVGGTGGENGVGMFFAVRFRKQVMAVTLLRWQNVNSDIQASVYNPAGLNTTQTIKFISLGAKK